MIGNMYFVLVLENIFVFNYVILYIVLNFYNYLYKNIILCLNYKYLYCIFIFIILFIKIYNVFIIYKSKKYCMKYIIGNLRLIVYV